MYRNCNKGACEPSPVTYAQLAYYYVFIKVSFAYYFCKISSNSNAEEEKKL